jgi:hypothetical protein
VQTVADILAAVEPTSLLADAKQALRRALVGCSSPTDAVRQLL